MFENLADVLVWTLRLVLFAGVAWGAWLCVSHAVLPAGSQKTAQVEHFATFALIALLLTTLGGVLHGG